ncbi:hypothetical protein D1P53_005494 [Cryptococcus gattii VGV]|nr:hypothetical protein D1P53_005494 [Cryptococcus gattii VGV]
MSTNSQVIAAPYEEKLNDEMIEDVAVKQEDHAIAILPESLWGMSEEERNALERKIVRKMDLIVLPIIMILYILNYIDRQNLAVSKLQGIMIDLDLTTQQFATCVSVLFAGYLPFQIPSNYIISRIPRPGLSAVRSYSALVGIRVVLGAVEAVFFPERVRKAVRRSIHRSTVGERIRGLIAAGVLKLDGKHGIRGWRWLFIVEGTATVGFGIIFAFLMPEFPHNARVLKPVERDLAVWRLEQEAGAGEAHDDTSTARAYLSALKDPKVYMLIGCMICSQAMGSVGNFFPTILAALGYDSLITLCLTAPPYIFACFIFAGISWWSDRKQILYWPIILCLCIGIVIYIIAMTTLNVGARYFAMMWTPVANVVPQLFIYNTLSLHVARPYPKRAAGLALINAIGGTSNIWGSYVWFEPPHFYAGFGMVLAVNVVFLCIITFYRFFVRRENRRLDAGGEQARAVMSRGVTEEQMSLGWRFVGY